LHDLLSFCLTVARLKLQDAIHAAVLATVLRLSAFIVSIAYNIRIAA